MPMSRRLRWYLDARGVKYEVLPHLRTQTSLQTARQAHIAPERLAKSVLLEDEQGYLMAILPASRRIELGRVERQLGRQMELATEPELVERFDDCQVGAVPALGEAFGIRTLIDDSLLVAEDIYFEAGDHEDVVHVDGDSFRELMSDAMHGSFTQPLA
jgi:Ala-tRNA(Pro) deacylase